MNQEIGLAIITQVLKVSILLLKNLIVEIGLKLIYTISPV